VGALRGEDLDPVSIGAAATAQATPPKPGRLKRGWFLALLVAVGTCSAVDRLAVAIMGPAIAKDLALSDFQLGLTSGFGFAFVYLFLGLPLARMADRGNRVRLIAVCVAVWSACVLLSSVVRSFAQLMICRAIIGVGEAGVQPASVSLVSDLYPRERRGTALGVMALGVPIGTVIGSTAGGYLAEIYGWRLALAIIGAPGLLLALLFVLTLREPPRGGNDKVAIGADTPPLSAVFKLLASKRSFWHIIIAVGVINIAIFGIGTFLPVYFTRVMGLGLGQTGALNGVIGAISTGGFFLGGVITDRLGRRDERWHSWFAALGVLIGAPFYIAAFQVLDPILATGLLTAGGMAMFVYYTPVQLILQNMVAPRMRATTAFIFFFASGLVGAGLGPALVGFVSDMTAAQAFAPGSFRAACGDGMGTAACDAAARHGIRTALTVASLFFLWAALHLLLASRTLRQDILPAEDAAGDRPGHGRFDEGASAP